MRVLYLIDSLVAGGAERSLAAIAPGYAERGVQLDVAYLYERDNVFRPALEAAGARVRSLAGPGGRGGLVRRAHSLLGELRPDVLHTTLFDADVVGRCAALGTRTPVVCSLVNEAYGPEQRRNPDVKVWKLRAAQLVDAASARKVTRFHAVSESVAASTACRLHVRTDRVDVIPRGRDPRELGTRSDARRARARAALGARDGEVLVLAIGRHEYQKGFDVLLAAFAQLRARRPDARLLLAGREGNVTAELHASVRALGLDEEGDVRFLGFRADVADLLCAADLFVSPSRWEGSPGSVIEAMALRTPIVATDIGPVREVLGESGGALLAPAGEAGALARTMLHALDDPGAPARASAAHARFAARYTIDVVADEMVAFYERAARAAARG